MGTARATNKKGDYHHNWGGAREGAGRPPGPARSLAEARKQWREKYAEEAIETISDLMKAEDPWLRFAAAKEILDRCWGKTHTHISIDEDTTITAVYETMDEMRQDLIESGIPLDHLELVRHEPEESAS